MNDASRAFAIFFVGLILTLGPPVTSAFGQTDGKRILLRRSEPALSIVFKKFESGVPIGDNDSGQFAVLQVRNNMRASVRFCRFGVSNEGEILKQATSKLWINYDVEYVDLKAWVGKEKPRGVLLNGRCNIFELTRGKSARFRIPMESLAPGLRIQIGFTYEWEDFTSAVTEHSIYFYSDTIPPNAPSTSPKSK